MYLGIDTSNYTTSLALVRDDGQLLQEVRKILPVNNGEQGLRQSTALFYHLQHLPELCSTLFKEVEADTLKGIGVSTKPRSQASSYMPVFRAGHSFAQSMASILHCPLVETSHQAGHLEAGYWSAGMTEKPSFLALHASGGTTELLLVRRVKGIFLNYEIELLGGTLDLHAGQAIDRVGVTMGLSFPAGPELERLAQKAEIKTKLVIPSAVKGYNVSFSGAETKAKSFLEKGAPPEEVARALEHCLALTMEKVLRKAVEETKIKDILLVGGVGANGYIRNRLLSRLTHPAVGGSLYFPQPQYSSDNAVGVGLIAQASCEEYK